MKNTEFQSDFKKAFKASIPVLCGYLFLGFGFGVILATKGYGPLWAFFMSATTISGAMQYIACDLIANKASLLVFAYTTLLVNFRYCFYGFSTLQRYKDYKSKVFLIFATTDETFALLCSESQLPEVYSKERYCVLVSLLDWCYWIIGGLIGNVIGGLITFNTTGIDFVLTALFLTVIVDQWRDNKDHTPVLCGFFISLVCLILCGPEFFLFPTMALIILVLSLREYTPWKGVQS